MFLNRFAFLKDVLLRKPLLFAAIAALSAALFASGYLSRKETHLLRLAEPVKTVVASRDISSGEVIEDSMISLRSVPRRFLQSGALFDAALVVGRIAQVPIKTGTQMTSSIARRPSSLGALTGMIPVGRRAIALGMKKADAVGGLLRPNDLVDVIATFDLGGEQHARRTTFTVVNDVQVLAVGKKMAHRRADEEKRAKGGSIFGSAVKHPYGDELTIALAVTPAEAQEIALAKSAGQLVLALRPFEEPDEAEELDPATISSIAGEDETLVPFRKKFREYRGR